MSSHEAVLGVILPTVIGAILLAALFLPRWPLAVARAPADQTLAYLARRLRLARHRVEAAPDHLKVRIDSFSAVRVWATPGETTRLRFQADATPGGWSLVMFLFFLGLAASGLVGVLASLTVVALFARAFVFVRGVGRLLPADSFPADAPGPGEVDALLLEGLAEAQRLAAEAYEAHRSSYWDAQAIAFLGAIFAWALALVLAVTTGTWWIGRPLEVAAFATATATAFAIPSSYLVWRRYRDRLRQFRQWASHLEAAWLQQADRAAPVHTEPSTFEVLAQASAQVPTWIDATRRAGFLEAPHTGFLPVVLGLWGALTVQGGVAIIIGIPALGVALVGGGVALLWAALEVHRRWRRAQDAAANRLLSEWTRRYDGIRGRMERFLEEL